MGLCGGQEREGMVVTRGSTGPWERSVGGAVCLEVLVVARVAERRMNGLRSKPRRTFADDGTYKAGIIS